MSRCRLEIESSRGTTFVANCVDELRPYGMNLLQQLSDYERNVIGPIEEGTIIELGWSRVTLRRRPDGVHLEEPDFGSDPFSTTRDDVSTSLLVMVEQRDFMQGIGLPMTSVSFHNSIAVGGDALNLRRVYFERVEPAFEGDSGWYLGPRNVNDSRAPLSHRYVWNLVKERPVLLRFIVLPVGSMVLLTGEKIDKVVDAKGIELGAYGHRL